MALTRIEKQQLLLNLLRIEIEAYRDTITDLNDTNIVTDDIKFECGFYDCMMGVLKNIHDSISIRRPCDIL